jgi:hypothetical protein
MTDAELIARLREGATWDDDVAAADRIEQLVATNEALTTKLAKAVAALEYYAVEAMPWDADDTLMARTALAEIKGDAA